MGYDLFLYGKIAQKSHGLWVMGYGCNFPANQLGKSKKVCLMREYGLYLVWVRRVSTVATASRLSHVGSA